LMAQLEQAGYLNRDTSEKTHRFVPTGKQLSDIKIDDLTFTEEEFQVWKQKESAKHAGEFTIIESSCDLGEAVDDPKRQSEL